MKSAELHLASDMIYSEAGQSSVEPIKKACSLAAQSSVALEEIANGPVRYLLVPPLS